MTDTSEYLYSQSSVDSKYVSERRKGWASYATSIYSQYLLTMITQIPLRHQISDEGNPPLLVGRILRLRRLHRLLCHQLLHPLYPRRPIITCHKRRLVPLHSIFILPRTMVQVQVPRMAIPWHNKVQVVVHTLLHLLSSRPPVSPSRPYPNLVALRPLPIQDQVYSSLPCKAQRIKGIA